MPGGDDEKHYHGHRQRLRERFLEAGADALADYELLELLLFRTIPRRDVKPLAKALIKRHGSFAEVLTALPARLREGGDLSEASIADFKIVEATAKRLARQGLQNRKVMASFKEVIDYCRAAMGYADREEFRVLFLDKKNQLLSDEVMNHGTVDHAPVYPREVVRRALELSSSAIILVHNHPSGDPTPSSADVEMTRQIVEAARALRIAVHDHLVVGRDGVASFKALGLL